MGSDNDETIISVVNSVKYNIVIMCMCVTVELWVITFTGGNSELQELENYSESTLLLQVWRAT